MIQICREILDSPTRLFVLRGDAVKKGLQSHRFPSSFARPNASPSLLPHPPLLLHLSDCARSLSQRHVSHGDMCLLSRFCLPNTPQPGSSALRRSQLTALSEGFPNTWEPQVSCQNLLLRLLAPLPRVPHFLGLGGTENLYLWFPADAGAACASDSGITR